MLQLILTFISISVFSVIIFHISAQDFDAPTWGDPQNDQPMEQMPSVDFAPPPVYPDQQQPDFERSYVPSYPEPNFNNESPDFPQFPDEQPQVNSYGAPPPAYGDNPAYSYNDEGPGLLRQSTSTATICFCTPVGTCTNGTTNLGDGQIDVRVGGTSTNVDSVTQQRPIVTTTAAANVRSCSSSTLQLCCTPGPYQCGISWPAVRGSPTPQSGQAAFGQYPWQVVLLSRNDTYLGSGALIDNFNVVTAAHKVVNYTASGAMKIRLGEWDSSGNREPIPAQEFSVSRVVIHPSFNSRNLRNSIAMLRLSAAVPLGMTPTINNICLPSSRFTSGTCFVSGWGKNDFRNGQYQAIQRSIDLPLVPTNTCESQLRNTRLGPSFSLDPFSFMCAGGKAGKDACTGDGGAPLVCQQGGKWYLAGLVAWGISCGDANVPGVYINITNYIPWMMNLTRV